MRILVTGGAGFIGSALVRYLVSEVGAEVLNVDKLTYAGNLASLSQVEKANNYHFLQADICDRAAMDQARAISSRPTSSAPSRCSKRLVATGTACPPTRRTRSASCMSPPMKSMARSETRGCSRRRPLTTPPLPIRHPRQPATIWRLPGTGPMACRSSSRTAPTITGRSTSRKSLFRS